jgi:hypothetical protein
LRRWKRRTVRSTLCGWCRALHHLFQQAAPDLDQN